MRTTRNAATRRFANRVTGRLCSLSPERVLAAGDPEPVGDILLVLLIIKLVIEAVLIINRVCPLFSQNREKLLSKRRQTSKRGKKRLEGLVTRKKYREAVKRYGITVDRLVDAMLDECGSGEEIQHIADELR